MLIAAFDKFVSAASMMYMPRCRYVLSENIHYKLTKAVEKDGGRAVTTSNFNPYLKHYGGTDLNGKTILINRHTAFGDQLIVTALCRYIKTLYPTCDILYFSEPGTVSIWLWNPDIQYCGGPIPFETAKACDHHLFIRGMFENDSEPDQDNCYDSMFRFAGFDPEQVPDTFKRPHIFLDESDETDIRHIKEEYGDYIVYQWQASNPNRTYPQEQSIATLQILQQQLPNHKVIVVGQMDKPPSLSEGTGVINLVNRTRDFRRVIQLVKGSKLVICPDSSVSHVAGAFPEIPCISLWGLFHPWDRVKYYDNHFPLHEFEVCPHAPCHNHDFHLPKNQCKDASNHNASIQYCNALRAITPQKIAALATSILTS